MTVLTHSIQQLPELLKNQIKAGEVITRPKDVVKEIMENALDAGADHLVLDIKEAGLVSIALRDNGSGISKEDLTLALTAHATSKLQSIEDLNTIETMGFRGEALASIVSVSRVTLSSQTSEQEHGWEIRASQDAFDPQGIKPSSIAKGTLLEIRDLFFNAKSRREFLSSVSAETQKIDDIVKKIALSHYDVSIEYQTDKKHLSIPKADACSDTKRLAAILGKNFASHALWLSEEKEGVSVKGFITNPQFQRARGDMQYLFINGRFIKDITLLSAMRRAYQDVMYQKNQPGLVIYIDIDPSQVDVNIHPTKEQVRIKKLHQVSSLLYHAIKNRLAALRPVLNHSFDHTSEEPILSESSVVLDKLPDIPMRSFSKHEDAIVESKPLEHLQATIPDIKEQPLGQALAQLQGIYILSQAKDGLILVDMHAAHERVVYESLKLSYQKEGLIKQALLVPISCSLTEEQVTGIEGNEGLLSQLGFDVHLISNDTCLIRSIPKVISTNSASVVFQKVLNTFLENRVDTPVETAVHELLSLIACHQAIRANRSLSLLEMNQLLREIESVSHGSQCNHGRPTWIHWTLKTLDGFFHRGQ